MTASVAVTAAARAQDGIVSRRDCLTAGLSRHAIDHRLQTGRWRKVHDGVYATVTGSLSFRQSVWAAVLFCGPGAAAAGGTALSVGDPRRRHTPPLTIAVPADRRVRPPSGVIVWRRTELPAYSSPPIPPFMPPEHAVLDLAATMRDDAHVVSLVCEAVRCRWVSPASLRLRLDDTVRHRWRRVIEQMVTETAAGVESPLESMDLRNDRAHGLPVGQRQVSVRAGGERRRLDVRIMLPNGRVLTKELDGRLGHESGRFRDRQSDNANVLRGATGLRFGYEDLFGARCGVAAVEVWVLRQLGWTGTPRRCGRLCRLDAELAQLAQQYPVPATAR